MEIYNKDPYPKREEKKNDFRIEKIPRVPPFRDLDRLVALQAEKAKADE